jgi:hypothetical protein
VSFNHYFNDFSNYTNAWLHQLLQAGEAAHHGLAISVESWRRQRQYVDWALEVRLYAALTCSVAQRTFAFSYDQLIGLV